MRCSLVLVVPLVLIASACGDSGPDSCLPDCPTTRSYDARSYALHAHYDWERQRLSAREDITLALASADEAVVELDAEVDVSAVRSGEGRLAYQVDGFHHLNVDLSPLTQEGATEVSFTVEYEVGLSDALVAAGPRDDDPVVSRVVYTDSEPDRGRRWLVAKHDPSDRALFSVELELGVDEDAVANGERVADGQDDRGRVVAYALDQPIPTYLMAFAAGELEHTDRAGGRVPLSLWYRRGLAVNPDDNLDAVAQAMAHFEELVGPYPWERYSVVLLPQFPGGMENATITFNNELTGQGVVGFQLNAHELSHHWFGDWVTMRGYDDLWVKEGMATLLSAEATRATRDREGKGRLFASDFRFDPDDAIVDETLTGLDKYTSGPYERAAWLLTQIRAKVGEEAFWSSARKVLEEHRLDSIDGESFLRSFAPALDEPTIQKLLAALPLKGNVPQVTLANQPLDVEQQVTLTLVDPAQLLLAPVEITVVDASGQASTQTLAADTPLVVSVPVGGYLAVDERDGFGDFVDTYPPEVVTPAASDALVAFTSRSARHQERALDFGGLPQLAPDQLAPFYQNLDSEDARRQALVDACLRLPEVADPATWASEVQARLLAPSSYAFDPGLGACAADITSAIGASLSSLGTQPPAAGLDQLEYLLSFDYFDASFGLIAPIATTSNSLRVRDFALSRLSLQARGAYSPVSAAAQPEWAAFFRARLDETTSERRFRTVWAASVGLHDLSALPLGAAMLHTVVTSSGTQARVVCDAFKLTVDAPAAWSEFQAAAEPWSTLTPEAQALLADPTPCQN
jgi:aminopeptidase N